jgi:chromosome segregation ATPase
MGWCASRCCGGNLAVLTNKYNDAVELFNRTFNSFNKTTAALGTNVNTLGGHNQQMAAAVEKYSAQTDALAKELPQVVPVVAELHNISEEFSRLLQESRQQVTDLQSSDTSIRERVLSFSEKTHAFQVLVERVEAALAQMNPTLNKSTHIIDLYQSLLQGIQSAIGPTFEALKAAQEHLLTKTGEAAQGAELLSKKMQAARSQLENFHGNREAVEKAVTALQTLQGTLAKKKGLLDQELAELARERSLFSRQVMADADSSLQASQAAAPDSLTLALNRFVKQREAADRDEEEFRNKLEDLRIT